MCIIYTAVLSRDASYLLSPLKPIALERYKNCTTKVLVQRKENNLLIIVIDSLGRKLLLFSTMKIRYSEARGLDCFRIT